MNIQKEIELHWEKYLEYEDEVLEQSIKEGRE